jgi:CYTH domain-containing protein
MPIETERKFLVIGTDWKDGAPSKDFSQAYLSQDPERSVRVRIAGDQAFLTIKGMSQGISRQEFEYPIPVDDARQLLSLCLPAIISKTRYFVEIDGRQWEVDEFHDDNQGLVIAEIELDNESDAVELPKWVGKEVSDDRRYYNVSLAKFPYSKWN